MEVASGTEDWSLRYVNVELTEDKELVLPMLVNEELIRSSYDFDAEPLAASDESATIAGFRPYYDGEPIVKIVTSPKLYGLKAEHGVYNAFNAYYDTRYTKPTVPYVSLPIWGEGELDGAVFEIRATEAVVIDGISYAEGDVVDTLITGENSTSIALPLGRWELTEIKAPDGYEIDPDSQSEIVELTAAEGSNEVTVQEVRRVNKKADIALTVYKRFFGLDEAEAAGLYKNVYFGIYADQDISATDGKVIISKHMLLDVIEIGEDGRGTKDDLYLPAGSYYVKELATADGYMVDETKYSFTVRAADTDEIAIEGIDEDNPVVNYTEGSIPFAFRKTDENKDPLEGAEFTLYRCTDDTAGHEHSELAGEENSCWTEISGIAPKISGADGIVDFNRLPAGDYQLAETKAPDGYKRPTGQWYIHVAPEADTPITIEARGNELPPAFMKTEDTDICQYQVKNYEDGGMPWSGGRGVFPYLGGGSSLLAAAALLFKRRREEEPDEKKKTAE